MKKTFFITALCLLSIVASAQKFKPAGYQDERTMGMKPEMTELYAPVPPKVEAGDICTNSAPSDAIVLFDGKNLDMWCNDEGGKAGWQINKDGSMTVVAKNGGIKTRDSFGDCQLHIEWRSPADIEGSGQGRGNSGVFLQNRYEVQVLECYENTTYVNGMVGSIYKQSAPLVNPCRKPGEWNVYDIIYTAPTFKEDGTFRTNPYITVIFNGVIVQNHTMILGTTEYIGLPTFAPHGDEPIALQAHGNPVQFRNIWIRKL